MLKKLKKRIIRCEKVTGESDDSFCAQRVGPNSLTLVETANIMAAFSVSALSVRVDADEVQPGNCHVS